MKTSPLLRLLLALLLGLFALARPALAADVSVKGLLIVASKKPGTSDKKLAAYETNLRNLPGGFQTFQLLGEGTISVPAGGKATLNLAQGHRIEFSAAGASFDAKWLKGNAVLLEQPVRLGGGPLLLGGPEAGSGDVFAVLLLANPN